MNPVILPLLLLLMLGSGHAAVSKYQVYMYVHVLFVYSYVSSNQPTVNLFFKLYVLRFKICTQSLM